ncbi:hypothetical protein GCM10018790_74110 [Kitasatospora xanthocidica]|uniref:hypothetical protein n=1 Tax=Kitasatospora xanthocidica TaxID=83382 RepID=UPI0016733151|nr:hypothetical protein [Kitasatospora xanthocidica]GHF85793.1 hypothetical protein GCM10018790_74110 [Kitasatospora xanthocidica]
MGVLTDYFRAPDAAAVVRALELTGGGRPDFDGGSGAGFDGVEAKRVDPYVVLGRLVAAIREEAWLPDVVPEKPVWPATPPPGPDGPQDEDDPWATGPWVTELGTTARDTLAGVPDERLPEVVAQWALAEEWDGANASDLLPLAEELIDLARRARAAGEQLYCWICL